MGNIFKSDFVFLGLVIIASLLFVSGLGSSAIMGLLGYSGLSLAEVMARTELNAAVQFWPNRVSDRSRFS